MILVLSSGLVWEQDQFLFFFIGFFFFFLFCALFIEKMSKPTPKALYVAILKQVIRAFFFVGFFFSLHWLKGGWYIGGFNYGVVAGKQEYIEMEKLRKK